MLSLLLSSMLACSLETPEEKKARLKTERTEILDSLYTEYGGGTFSNATAKVVDEAKKEVKTEDAEAKKTTNAILSTISNTFSEADREGFVAHCKTIGQGDHATILTDKAKQYFAQQTVKEKCRKVHSLELEIKKLESGS